MLINNHNSTFDIDALFDDTSVHNSTFGRLVVPSPPPPSPKVGVLLTDNTDINLNDSSTFSIDYDAIFASSLSSDNSHI